MYYKIVENSKNICKKATQKISKKLFSKHLGIDGILVTVGLCIIALVLCVLMKDKLAIFIGTIVTEMTQKASTILKMTS